MRRLGKKPSKGVPAANQNPTAQSAESPGPPKTAAAPKSQAKVASTADENEKGQPASSDLTSIGGSVALVTTMIAALGSLALTGTVGRVQRDDPFWLGFAIGSVILAGLLWTFATILFAPRRKSSPSRAYKLLRVVALLFAGAGFFVALVTGVKTASHDPRPQITPSLSEDGSKLTAHITASGLSSNQRLAMRIDELREDKPVATLFRGYIGPNSDGGVDQTITVPLGQGKYTAIGIKAYTGETSPACDEFAEVQENSTFRSGTGCVILAVPKETAADSVKTGATEEGGAPAG